MAKVPATKKEKITKTKRKYTKPLHNPSWWKKGEVQNPHGRPKLTPEQLATSRMFRQACRERSPEALEAIEMLTVHADRDSVRLAASSFIIEHGFGKALQTIEASGPDGGPIPVSTTPLSKEQLLDELKRRGLPLDILTTL